MKRWTMHAALAAAISTIFAAGCQSSAPPSPPPPAAAAAQAEGGAAEYTITIASTWTPATHPHEYPAAGALTGPHFSRLVGTSHGAGFALFQEGALPTPGLERLSEQGKDSPLDDEIEAAVGQGKAGMFFESDALRDFSKTAAATVRVTDTFPMVSAVAMIAPSPDWFAGAASVSLKDEAGKWVPGKTVSLYAFDAGSDDGTTYKASDVDVNPKKATTMARTPHFVVNGTTVPVGTLTFTRR